MIITDSKGNGGGSSALGGYSIDDPWTSSSSPSRPGTNSTSSRPLTWAPGSAQVDRSSRTLQYQSSDAGEDGATGIKLPGLYESTWELCRAAEQGDDVGISLGQLGKVVRCAQALGAADVERVSEIEWRI